jgi:hypothetical protein
MLEPPSLILVPFLLGWHHLPFGPAIQIKIRTMFPCPEKLTLLQRDHFLNSVSLLLLMLPTQQLLHASITSSYAYSTSFYLLHLLFQKPAFLQNATSISSFMID